jgi:hypothetical protein
VDTEERFIYSNKGKMKKDINSQIYRILGKYFDDGPYFSSNKHLEALYFLFWKYFYKIKGFPFTIKYFFQRLFRGYDDLDKWNIAWYIARKAAPILKDWRNGKMHGSAIIRHREDRFGSIIELTDSEIYAKSNSNDYQGPEALSLEQWQAVLDDIIFAFQWQVNYDSLDCTVSDVEFKSGNKRQKRGLKLFSIYFTSLWD